MSTTERPRVDQAPKIELGHWYKDMISGFAGIADSHTHNLDGTSETTLYGRKQNGDPAAYRFNDMYLRPGKAPKDAEPASR